MKHYTLNDVSPAAGVLVLEQADVPPFVRKCVEDRSLSTLVSELNDALLFGTAEQKDEAGRALNHLGFL